MEEDVNVFLATAAEFEQALVEANGGKVKRKRGSGVPRIPSDRARLSEWWRKVLGQEGVNGAVLARVVAEGLRAERPVFGPNGQVEWAPDHGVRRQYFVEAAKVMGLYPAEQDIAIAASPGGVVVRMTPGLQGGAGDEYVDGEVIDDSEPGGGVSE